MTGLHLATKKGGSSHPLGTRTSLASQTCASWTWKFGCWESQQTEGCNGKQKQVEEPFFNIMKFRDETDLLFFSVEFHEDFIDPQVT